MEFQRQSIGQWLDELAGDNPAPGGGAAAALCCALSAALVSMVARFTVNKKKYESVRGEAETLLAESEKLRVYAQNLMSEDAAAFAKVAGAYAIPKTDATRPEAIQSALQYATEIPLAAAETACGCAELALKIAAFGNKTVLADAGSAAILAKAAADSALLNVYENIRNLDNHEIATRFQERAAMAAQRLQHIVPQTLAYMPFMNTAKENEIAK